MTPSKTVLVIIDVQNGLVNAPVHARDGMLARIASLAARARRSGVPVIYVQDDDVGEVGSEAWEIHPAIRPEAGDVRVRKPACDAFHETELLERLQGFGAEHLVVAGCKTEFCIDTTCRRATTLGYNVTLAADAHSTTDSPALAAPAIIAHHNHSLHGFGAYVRGKPCEISVVPSAEIGFG